MPRNVWLNIHLKGGEKLGKKTAQVIVELNRENQSIVACGKEASMGVRTVSSQIRVCNMERQADRKNYIDYTIKNEHKFIQLLKRRGTKNLEDEIQLLKGNDIKINYYGTDSELEIKRLFKIGVDFVLVNELSSSLKIAEGIGLKPMNYKK